MRPKHLPHKHIANRYPHSLGERLWEAFIVPLFIMLALAAVLYISGHLRLPLAPLSTHELLTAAVYTCGRLLIAYVLALISAIPLALWATHSPFAQKILLPLFDVLESVPILAFFPLLIVFFISIGLPDGAAIFILFLSMLWNIVFATIGGVGLIPKDILYAAEVFGIRGFSYMRRVVAPAVVPQAVVGSILAFAQGWNIIIVAEVIRTYLPSNSLVPNLFGLGSILVESSSAGQNTLFISTLGVVVLIIALVNFFVWQKLLKYSQRFRFE